jgi:dTDP-L-rhamnose 4-epimerase
MRALISDTGRIAALGYAPTITLVEGIDRYLAWIATQGDVKEYFSDAERRLRERNIVKRARTGATS